MYLQLIILFAIIKILSLQHTSLLVNALGSTGIESDRLSLLEFKRGIANDPFAVLNSWNDSTSFCSWHGVTCSRRHKRVAALDLRGLKLRGTVSPHIGNLTFLRTLDLGNNSFYGKIPLQVGFLFRLHYLYLLNNTFTGEIPTQLSNCSQLRTIDIWGNRLVGGIPYELGSLTKLKEFQLGMNNLTASIPPSIGNFSSLEIFVATYNNLEGSIPDDIGRLKSLSILAVAVNKLSGRLPYSLYNISSLAKISLSINKLNGTLPANIGLMLPKLDWFGISRNDFSGPIPLSLSNASQLQVLDLSENSFVGAVPRDLGKLIDLWLLGFSSNSLGSNSTHDLDFISTLKNATQLQILDVSYNKFGGAFPASIANLSSQLSILHLSGNQIYGVIPQTLEKYTNLRVLSMPSNLFTGIIPSYFGKFQNMQGLYLYENRLSGLIPSSFGNLTQLVDLYLSDNNLNGSIPPSIGNCENLRYLDLSENNLTGAIPKEVTDLSSLSLLLNLSHNLLTGNLPVGIGNLKTLNQLDFSENNLTGEIPITIGDCGMLEYLDLQGNSFQGVIPSSLAYLKGLTHLDLSRNNLSGNIPKDLRKLHFLSYLDVSFNDLEGEVPSTGVFRNASAISMIGNNKLCGGVLGLQLPTCPDNKPRKHGVSDAVKRIIIIASVTLCFLFLSSFLVLYWKRKSKKLQSTEEWHPHQLSKVSYKMLYDATRGFSPDNLIGSGSFGFVYKGILDSDETVVAVKVLNLQQTGACKSFMAECMALRNIRHRNLVKIITSCSSMDYQGNEFMALVFEFMKNSSLDEWLHQEINGESQSRKLNILQRLDVAIDVAYALHYLHIESVPPIVHCDLKPSNVLLDDDMDARVGDFGLARILQTTTSSTHPNQSSTIGLKGSIGYAPPEYGMGGKASIQGDIYSYGILLLEMFMGRRPTDEVFKEGSNIHQFAKMALPERLMQVVDPSLIRGEVEVTTAENDSNSEIVAQEEVYARGNPGQMNNEMKRILNSVLEIGIACSVEPPIERMKIGEVIRELLSVKNSFPRVGVTNGPRRRHF